MASQSYINYHIFNNQFHYRKKYFEFSSKDFGLKVVVLIYGKSTSKQICSAYFCSVLIIIQSVSGAMIKPIDNRRPQKSGSKSTSKEKLQLNTLKELQRVHAHPNLSVKLKNKTKSTSKCKSQHRHSKDSFREQEESRPRLEKAPKQNLFIQNRRRMAASEDKPEKSKGKKDRFFKRKNQQQQQNRRSSSRKDSKRSTDNENEETLIQRLKAENQYYKNAFLTSRESLQRVEKYLLQEKQKRSNEKEWFKYQINNLKRQLTSEKLQLGHIFTFDSFQHQDISNMIIETENEGSSLLQPDIARPQHQEIDNAENLSELSIDSK